jgi:hypothetical protein
LSSVASVALENGCCPFEAKEFSESRGEELYWILSLGSMLTATPRAKTVRIVISFGMLVKCEGHHFRIVPRANNNMGLKPFDPNEPVIEHSSRLEEIKYCKEEARIGHLITLNLFVTLNQQSIALHQQEMMLRITTLLKSI